jgi:hypothetical protein
MMLTISSPALLNGKDGRLELAAFYGALLGMDIVSDGWLQIGKHREAPFRIVLDGDGWSDERPPRWPDPEFPQQMHVDVRVRDLDEADRLVMANGATVLQDEGAFRTYADPAGHPFCLYPDPSAGDDRGPGTVGAVVFDCFSPRSLARFYEGFIGVDRRIEDSPGRVVLALALDERYPNLAFQHAEFVAARWPDDAYPAQLHVDWRFEDKRAALERVEQFGGIRLPKLADTEIFADPAAHPFCV